MTTKPQHEPSSLTGDLLPIVRAVDAQSRHPDWSADARKHFHQAGVHLLAAVASIRRAELGIPAGREAPA